MNSKEYIESGVLELYALNELDPAGRLEVERMALQYPEIDRELREIEKTYQNLAFAGSIKPKEGLKDRIAQSLSFQNPIQEKPEAKMVSLGLYVWSLAACFLVLLVSVFSIFMLNQKLKETQSLYSSALEETKRYASQTQYIQNQYQRNLQAQTDTNTILLKLKGGKNYPNAIAILYWNRKDHAVKINPNSLPENDSDHSYQLWAMVDGKPIDEGVFDSKKDRPSLNSMKNREKAQAFAITLEPRGGSPNPHLNQLVAIVNI